MTSINLYKRHRKENLDVTVEISSEWNELNVHELLFICKILTTDKINTYEGKARILMHLIDCRLKKNRKLLPPNWKQQLSAEDVAIQGIDTIAWLFDTSALTNQLLPEINFFTEMLYGPESSFNDITCGEFEDAEVFFLKYDLSKNPEDMAMITAILWRPAIDGKRIRYGNYEAHLEVKKILQRPEIVLANYIWYIGCRMTLPPLFPGVFIPAHAYQSPDLTAFTKCIHAGAGVKNGVREMVRRTLLKEFLLDLQLESEKTD